MQNDVYETRPPPYVTPGRPPPLTSSENRPIQPHLRRQGTRR